MYYNLPFNFPLTSPPFNVVLIHKKANLENIRKHFLSLDDTSRSMRFGGANITDDFINQYIEKFLKPKDLLFAIFDLTGDIIGFSHVAFLEDKKSCELGLSVLSTHRNKGYGKKLFDESTKFIKALGINKIFVNFLTKNKTMQHLAQSNGMSIVVHAFDEATGVLNINNEDQETIVDTVKSLTHVITNNNMMLIDAAIKNSLSKYIEFVKPILSK